MTKPQYFEKEVLGHQWIIDFSHAGVTYPVHVHDDASNHTTTVARGSIEETESKKIYRCGDVIVWPANKPHGFRALEDNTRLVNVRIRPW